MADTVLETFVYWALLALVAIALGAYQLGAWILRELYAYGMREDWPNLPDE